MARKRAPDRKPAARRQPRTVSDDLPHVESAQAALAGDTAETDSDYERELDRLDAAARAER